MITRLFVNKYVDIVDNLLPNHSEIPFPNKCILTIFIVNCGKQFWHTLI